MDVDRGAVDLYCVFIDLFTPFILMGVNLLTETSVCKPASFKTPL